MDSPTPNLNDIGQTLLICSFPVSAIWAAKDFRNVGPVTSRPTNSRLVDLTPRGFSPLDGSHSPIPKNIEAGRGFKECGFGGLKDDLECRA